MRSGCNCVLIEFYFCIEEFCGRIGFFDLGQIELQIFVYFEMVEVCIGLSECWCNIVLVWFWEFEFVVEE